MVCYSIGKVKSSSEDFEALQRHFDKCSSRAKSSTELRETGNMRCLSMIDWKMRESNKSAKETYKSPRNMHT